MSCIVKLVHYNIGSGARALNLALSDHGNDGTVRPGTVRSASTVRRGSEADNGSPLSKESTHSGILRASGPACDEQVSDLLGALLESVAGMANFEPAMEGTFKGLAEKPLADLTSEMKLNAKQVYHLLVNTVRGRRSITELQRGNASSLSTSQTQLDDTLQPVGTFAARRTHSWIN